MAQFYTSPADGSFFLGFDQARDLNFLLAWNQFVSSANAGEFIVGAGDYELDIYGTGFTYDGGVFSGGTITEIYYYRQGSLTNAQRIEITSLSFDAATFATFLNANNNAGLLTALTAGNDLFEFPTGGRLATLVGGAGDDTYNVGPNYFQDVLIEGSGTGSGNDTVVIDFSGGDFTLGDNLENIQITATAAVSDVIITGNSLNNLLSNNSDYALVIQGMGGNDTLVGSYHSDDTLEGGQGNDVYVLNDSNTVVIEATGGGNDTIVLTYGTGTYFIPDKIENVSGWDGDDSLFGSTIANVIRGNSGDDALHGGTGDTLYGGADNDRYFITSTDVTISDSAGTADSLILMNGQTSFSLLTTSFVGIEHVFADAGTSAHLIGDSGANSLTGTDYNDTIESAGGADTLEGYAGDDLYVITGDYEDLVIIESQLMGGTDTVHIALNTEDFVLSDNVDIVISTFAEGGYGSVTGNSNDNTLVGSADLGNSFFGEGGNDSLVGGSGDDYFEGGAGDDTLVGLDGDDELRGDAGNDSLIGGDGYDTLDGGADSDTLLGGADDDDLDGGTGDDVMIGGDGDDYYWVDSSNDAVIETSTAGGIDLVFTTIDYTLGENVDDAVLESTGVGQYLQGNTLDNALYGNESLASTLVGGGGYDSLFAYYEGTDGTNSLVGGSLDDTYYFVGNAVADILDAGGNDTIILDAGTAFNLASAAGVENIFSGNDNTYLTGNALANSLWGFDGDDTLEASGGNDTLIGGFGDDFYIIAGTTDVLLDDGGTDTVVAGFSIALAGKYAKFENAALNGMGTGLTVTGNSLANVLTGNGYGSALIGLGGNDTLRGSELDTLNGGAGNDVYRIAAGASLSDVTLVEAAKGGIDTIVIDGDADLTPNPLKPGFAQIENITLLSFNSQGHSATGNSLANVITGTENDDSLRGAAGNDTLIAFGYNSDGDTLEGGLGNDVYVIADGSTSDLLIEASNGGVDTVLVEYGHFVLGADAQIENLVGTPGSTDGFYLAGNTLANRISGADGDDCLEGGGGKDTLIGGKGNDFYVVTGSLTKILELPGTAGGTDTVRSDATFSAAAFANVETIYLTGTVAANVTGNALANTISGNSLANIVTGGAGNDTLRGFVEGSDGVSDTLIGGAGNDVYYYEDSTDFVVEKKGEGTDILLVRGDYDLSNTATAIANIEGAVLTATDAGYTLKGNSLANILGSSGSGNASLVGDAGNDTLYTHAGDTVQGGLGNDVYVVTDPNGLFLTEFEGEGTADLVVIVSDSAYVALPDNVENGLITATGGATLRGNGLANKLTGGAGDDGLDATTGDTLVDTLAGGSGNDRYYLDSTKTKVVEAPGTKGGTDTIEAYVSLDLNKFANVENLDLYYANGTVNGTGNGLNNAIYGNSVQNILSGGLGNDTLGGEGNNGSLVDTLIGGAGNDVYYYTGAEILKEVAKGGLDTVYLQSDMSAYAVANVYSISLLDPAFANFENITVDDEHGVDMNLTGNSLANVFKLGLDDDVNATVTGGAGNDTIYSGSETATLDGGVGNDVYVMEDYNGTVIEATGAGIDTVVLSYIDSFDLADAPNVENLTADQSVSTQLSGNSLVNILHGGNLGDDFTSYGDSVKDSLIGGNGDDYYYVDNSQDVIIEKSGTTAGEDDRVYSSVNYILPVNVETLLLEGSAVKGTGNSGNNNIVGQNGVNNLLNGGGGSDYLIGGFSAGERDTLTGGAGADLFALNPFNITDGNSGYLLITDFDFKGGDRLLLSSPSDAFTILSGAALNTAASGVLGFTAGAKDAGLFVDNDLVAVVRGNSVFTQAYLQASEV